MRRPIKLRTQMAMALLVSRLVALAIGLPLSSAPTAQEETVARLESAALGGSTFDWSGQTTRSDTSPAPSFSTAASAQVQVEVPVQEQLLH